MTGTPGITPGTAQGPAHPQALPAPRPHSREKSTKITKNCSCPFRPCFISAASQAPGRAPPGRRCRSTPGACFWGAVGPSRPHRSHRSMFAASKIEISCLFFQIWAGRDSQGRGGWHRAALVQKREGEGKEGWMEEKVEGRHSSVLVEAFSWEIQLYKPLEMDNSKEKVVSRLFSTALLGRRCCYSNRGELQPIKPNPTACTNSFSQHSI